MNRLRRCLSYCDPKVVRTSNTATIANPKFPKDFPLISEHQKYYLSMETVEHKPKPEMTATVQFRSVTARAVLQRANRKLKHDFERLRKRRDGLYEHVDVYRNMLLGTFDDLESFARQCRVLHSIERIVD